MRVLITRPEEDATALAKQLAFLGIAALIEPLLEICFLPHPPLDLAGVQALLMTSANGVRAFANICERRDLPVLAVGEATARVAREAGFADVESAAGNVFDLAELVRQRCYPAAGPLLHAAGTAVAGDLAAMLAGDGFVVRREVLYEARTSRRLSEQTIEQLRAGKLDGVVMFSPRTAAVFVDLLAAAQLRSVCTRLIAFCLSWAVAHVIEREAWQRVAVAARPDQEALIDLIAEAADFHSPKRRIP
jgi:uroporphyrinogen-III synthase